MNCFTSFLSRFENVHVLSLYRLGLHGIMVLLAPQVLMAATLVAELVHSCMLSGQPSLFPLEHFKVSSVKEAAAFLLSCVSCYFTICIV